MPHPFEISVAPMMDWTDRHCRFFHRLIHPAILLYTEMVTTGAILYGDQHRFLRFNAEEHPLALQLGGCDPADLAECARIAEEYGYDEINLNCGCPSERVQKGAFGACLMAEPELVAECINAMQAKVNIPVTLKCRIGIDDLDDYAFLQRFVDLNKSAGCSKFIIHARKAWLKGLSPKENREIPELRYERVYDIKKEYPDLSIILNGGINTLDEVKEQVTHTDGVMIGRAAYHNPLFLRDIAKWQGISEDELIPVEEIVERMKDYAFQRFHDDGAPFHAVARHMMGLFQGVPGARAWRQHLSRISVDSQEDFDILVRAIPAKI